MQYSIWGIFVDRGPDSGGVVQFCIDKGIFGVSGNHDVSILNHFNRIKSGGLPPFNPDKQATLRQLNQTHIDYIATLPPIHVIDDLGLILVHGGIWPDVPVYAQNPNVIRVQMIHPDLPGKVRWWGAHATHGPSGKTEEQSRAEGWERWYKVYDHEQDVIFGHSTFAQPMIHRPAGAGRCIGIDTGSSFGGCLTAAIYSQSELFFISIKNKTVYCQSTTRHFFEV